MSININSENKCIVFGLTIVAALAFGAAKSSDFVFADDNDVVDIIGTVVPVSCNMTASGTTHSVTMHNRSYVPDIGSSTMVVTCTDLAGFSIYAAGFTGDVVGGTNSNKLVGTAASDYATIETGTATTAGDPDVSNWAMKLVTSSQATYPTTIVSGFNNYHAVPNSYTKVATRLTGTDAGPGAIGTTINTTYAVYVSGDQPSDIYSGKVKYVLVHPNTEVPQVSFEDAIVGSGGTKYKGFYRMQDVDSAVCAKISNGQTANLIDARDDNTYSVAKINGGCWMTQNLRITGVVSAEGSNFSTYSSVNVCEADLADGNGDYSDTRCHDSGNDVNGVWYNFTAASAKTITGSSNSNDATEDICPEGWHLPIYNTSKPADSINSIAGETHVGAFNVLLGGVYFDGTTYNLDRGYWWAANSSGTASRYNMYYNGTTLNTNRGDNRLNGDYIRCVN